MQLSGFVDVMYEITVGQKLNPCIQLCLVDWLLFEVKIENFVAEFLYEDQSKYYKKSFLCKYIVFLPAYQVKYSYDELVI